MIDGTLNKMIYSFGDSYSAYSKYVFQGRDPVPGVDASLQPDLKIKSTMSYLDHLSDLTGQAIGHLGCPGRGPLDMVDQLHNIDKTVLTSNDILIFCWSGMERDVDKWGDPYLDPAFDNTRYEGNDMQRYKDAVTLYHLFLASPLQHRQTFNSCLYAIDGMLQSISAKVVHLFCFNNELDAIRKHNLHNIQNGYVETNWNLYDHAHSFDDYGPDGGADIDYPNHYSPKGSIALAEHIHEKITN